MPFSFWNGRNIFPVDWKVFMSRQKEKILLTLNCSSLRELLWQGGAPITRNSSCVLFTKGPKAMFVSIETVATFPVFVMKKLLALYVCSHIYCHRNTIFLQQQCWCCYECKLLLLWCFLIIITAVLFPLFFNLILLQGLYENYRCVKGRRTIPALL